MSMTKALEAVKAAHGAWVKRSHQNASDVGLLRAALERVADGGRGGVHDLAREALADLARREASREARGEGEVGL